VQVLLQSPFRPQRQLWQTVLISQLLFFSLIHTFVNEPLVQHFRPRRPSSVQC
jgi:hypothetical protein